MKTDNELIAEFMGFEMISTDRWMTRYTTGLLDPYFGQFGAVHMRFDSSWGWLMPVVEKISKMDKMICINFYNDSHTTVTKIYSWGLGDDLHEAEFENESAIASVYQAVVNFIKWHHAQK